MRDSAPEHRPVYVPVGRDQLQPVRYVFVWTEGPSVQLTFIHVVPNPECRQQVVTWNMPQTSSRPVSEAGYGTTTTTHLPLVLEENLSQTQHRRDDWATTQAAMH